MFLKCIASGSSGNAYAIIEDNEILLLECGVPWKKIVQGIDFKPSKVVGCLVTHGHLDHLSSYKELLSVGIPVYSNDETADSMEIISGEKIKGLAERIPVKIGSFSVTPFYVPHTTRDKETGALIPCPNYGYLVQHKSMGKLLYLTDLEYCPYSFKSQRIEHFLIECNYIEDMVDHEQENYRHRLQGHASLDTCNGIITVNKTAALRTITLCHLSDTASDRERILSEVESVADNRVRVQIASVGMEPLLLNLCPF